MTHWLIALTGLWLPAAINLAGVRQMAIVQNVTVVLKFLRDTGADWEKCNVNGGAIALGHPIGATGSMLIGTVLDELERTDGRYGLVTMCAAGGMAPALIIERI